MPANTPHTPRPDNPNPRPTRSSTAPAYYLRRPRSEWMAAIAGRRALRRPAPATTTLADAATQGGAS